MKSNQMDYLLGEALRPTLEPSDELNHSILCKLSTETEDGTVVSFRTPARQGLRLARVAVIAAAVLLVGSTSVYAANILIKKVFFTEHTVSTGNPEYVDDQAIVNTPDTVTVTDSTHEEGDASVDWLTKDVEHVGSNITNTIFTYESYEKALKDSGFPNVLSADYECGNGACYRISDLETATSKELSAEFSYNEGIFYLNIGEMTGSVIEDMAFSLQLANIENKREYTSNTGNVFSLVDERRSGDEGEIVSTYVVVSTDKYNGYLRFNDLSEDEIHAVLDTIQLP